MYYCSFFASELVDRGRIRCLIFFLLFPLLRTNICSSTTRIADSNRPEPSRAPFKKKYVEILNQMSDKAIRLDISI